jgi:hypothetical protein
MDMKYEGLPRLMDALPNWDMVLILDLMGTRFCLLNSQIIRSVGFWQAGKNSRFQRSIRIFVTHLTIARDG